CLSAFAFFSSFGARRALHSFPTRRSSDLLRSRRRPVVLRSGVRSVRAEPVMARGRVNAPVVAPGGSHPPLAWMRRIVQQREELADRKSTRLNSSHQIISYAVFCLKKKK